MILHNLIYYLQFLPRVLFFLPCILSLFCPSLFHVCFLFISFAFIPSSFYSSLLSPCVVPFFLRFIILSLQFLVFAGFTLKSCHSRNTCCKFIVKFNVSCLEKEPKILKSLGGFLHERCICLMLSRVHVSVICVVCAPTPLWDVSTVVSHFTCQVCSTGWVRPAPLAGRGPGRCLAASSWWDSGKCCTGLSARPSEPRAGPPATCSKHILYLRQTRTSMMCPVAKLPEAFSWFCATAAVWIGFVWLMFLFTP